MDTGIYYGFASVDNGDVYKMVMSIGWNPFYDNTHKSMVSLITLPQNNRKLGHNKLTTLKRSLNNIVEEKKLNSLSELVPII